MIRQAGEPFPLPPAVEETAPYVERPADEELYQALLSGRWTFVAGLPESGKTSLAARTARRLNDAGIWALRLDLSDRRDQEPARCYAALAVQIGKAMGNEADAAAYVWDHQSSHPSEWLFGLIRELPASREGQIVLFLDGIDQAPAAGELVSGLTRLAEDPRSARVAMCLLDSSLLPEPETWLPFRNATLIRLTDFTADETRHLGAQMGEPQSAADAVYRWTEGHPALSRLLLAEARGDVDAYVRGITAEPGAEPHLAKAAERLLRPASDEDRTAVLNLYRKLLSGSIGDDGDEGLRRLKESGLCRFVDRRLRTRNPLYAKAFDAGWVRKSMPSRKAPQRDPRRRRRMFRAMLGGALGAAVLTGAAVGVWQIVHVLVARHRHPTELTMATYLDDLNHVGDSLKSGQYAEAKGILRDYRQFVGRTTAFDYLESIAEGGERVFFGHTNKASSVRFLNGGRRVATGGYDGTVTIFDIQSGELTDTLKIGEQVQCLAVSPDGKLLVAGTLSGSIDAIELATHKSRWKGKLGTGVNWVSFSRDGKLLAASGSRRVVGPVKGNNRGMTVGLWSAGDGHEIKEINDQGSEGSSLSFSPNDQRVAVGAADGCTYVYAVPDLKRVDVLIRNNDIVQSVWYSQDGHTIGEAQGDGSVSVDDVSGEFVWKAQGNKASANAIVGTRDGRHWITCGDDGHVRIWDEATGSAVADYNLGIELQDEWLSPDEANLAVAGIDGVTHILPLKALHLPQEVALGQQVACLSVAQRGPVEASADPAGVISVLNPGRGHAATKVTEPAKGRVASVSLSPDGRYLAAVYSGGTVNVLDLASRKTVLSTGGRVDSCFSPDGASLVVNRGAGVVRFSTSDWQPQATLGASHDADFRFVFSPDGERLIGMGLDGTNEIWDADSGKSLYRGSPPGSGERPVAWSPDGTLVAQYERWRNTIGIYDRDGKWISSLRAGSDRVEGLAFTPDSKLLVGVGLNTQLSFWDFSSGQMLIHLAGPSQSDRRVGFDEAGRLWLTGGGGPAYVVAPFTKQQYKDLDTRESRQEMLANRSRLIPHHIARQGPALSDDTGEVARERSVAAHDLKSGLTFTQMMRTGGMDGPGLLADKARYELLLGWLAPSTRDAHLLTAMAAEGVRVRGYRMLAMAASERSALAYCRKVLVQLLDEPDPPAEALNVVVACALCDPDPALQRVLSAQTPLLMQMPSDSPEVALARALVSLRAGPTKVAITSLRPVADDPRSEDRLPRLFALYGEVLGERKLGLAQNAQQDMARGESVYNALAHTTLSLDDQETFVALKALRMQALKS